MKTFKNGLYLFIGVSSLATFAGGWVLLAHSPKPIQPSQSQSSSQVSPTLAPIPSLDDLSKSSGNDSSLQLIAPQQSQSNSGFFAPLRSGGS